MEVLFYLLLLINAVSSITVSVIAPFFPPLAESLGLESHVVGIIQASNPIASMFAFVIVGKFINKVSKTYIAG